MTGDGDERRPGVRRDRRDGVGMRRHDQRVMQRRVDRASAADQPDAPHHRGEARRSLSVSLRSPCCRRFPGALFDPGPDRVERLLWQHGGLGRHEWLVDLCAITQIQAARVGSPGLTTTPDPPPSINLRIMVEDQSAALVVGVVAAEALVAQDRQNVFQVVDFRGFRFVGCSATEPRNKRMARDESTRIFANAGLMSLQPQPMRSSSSQSMIENELAGVQQRPEHVFERLVSCPGLRRTSSPIAGLLFASRRLAAQAANVTVPR